VATEEDWESYLRAVVDFVPRNGAPFRVVPERGRAAGPWPVGQQAPVVVVTAWNPDSERLSPEVNRARHELLVAEVDRLGADHWPAVGRDLTTPHHEEGVAVCGLSPTEGVALGARHGQAAVYLWTPDAWSVVSCTDGRRATTGWTLTERRTSEG